ncbi:LuxR C-terminal-related transcriptional regulator [Rhodobacteraceae bacterium KMM 6894]|nr:LuxR C-terminal-related transcriptional regulator [Rhodobacteraceae bacterium KMM 6894]
MFGENEPIRAGLHKVWISLGFRQEVPMSVTRSLADQMDTAGPPAQIWSAAIGCLPAMGLSKVIFMDLSQHRAPLILTNADDTWTERYKDTVKNGLDPFARNCLRGFATQLTGVGHTDDHDHLTQIELDQIAQGSAALDICTGMSVTMRPLTHGSGVGLNLMTTLDAREFANLRQEHEDTWRAWCQLVYAGLNASTATQSSLSLTEKQRDCLAYVADGFRTAEVAHKLSISEATVELHMRNARMRLHAKTRDQAVAIAVRTGLI